MNNPFGKHFLHYNLHKIGFQEPLAIGNPKKKEDVRDLVFTKLILAAKLNDDPIKMQRKNRKNFRQNIAMIQVMKEID